MIKKRILVPLFIIVFGFIYSQQDTLASKNKETARDILNQQIAKQYFEEYEKEFQLFKELNIKNKWGFTEGNMKYFAGFGANGSPRFRTTFYLGSNHTINTDKLWSGTINGVTMNYTGSGLTIYQWDENSPLRTHIELNNRITVGPTQQSASSDHSTFVAGLMIATGINPIVQGGAYQANIVAWDFFDVPVAELTSVANEAKISNHSYGTPAGWFQNPALGIGNDWIFDGDLTLSVNNQSNNLGYYDTQAVRWDKVVYDNPDLIVVKAVGNNYDDGPNIGENYYHWTGSTVGQGAYNGNPKKNCYKGYDCLIPESTSKNLFIIGGTESFSSLNDYRYTSPSDVKRYSKSSVGPTDAGAIKPDFVAPATNITSTSNISNSSYGTGGDGTSFAAPAITSMIGLLQQYYNQNNAGANFRADLLKALLAHTTNDAGTTGPDPVFGWGIPNAEKAIEVMTKNNETAIVSVKTINQGETIEIPVSALGTEPVKVTISWVDKEGTPVDYNLSLDNQTSMIVNDLDLRLVNKKDNTISLPWRLNLSNPLAGATRGDNTVDNVEQAEYSTPGILDNFVIQITHKGSLTGGSQTFGLIVTGITNPKCYEATQPVVNDYEVLLDCGITTTTLNLTNYENNILPNAPANYIFDYFTTEVNALNNEAVISNPANYPISVIPSYFYVRVTNNTTGCFNIAKLSVKHTSDLPTLQDAPQIKTCDELTDVFDGLSIFNIDSKQSQLLTTDPNITVKYFLTSAQANGTGETGRILDSNSYKNTIPFEQIIYARLTGTGLCQKVVPIKLIVNPTPKSTTLPTQVEFCSGEFTLNAGLGFKSYLWNTGATTSSIIITSAGTYSVELENEYGCKYKQNVVAIAGNVPVISNINIGENSLEVVATGGIKPYLYSLNNGVSWQSDNIFTNLQKGKYTMLVRSSNGCYGEAVETAVLSIPNIITPNSDGINDTWNIDYLEVFENATMSIYNRYGKQLLNETNLNNFEWNGTYLGNPLPSSTYWYILQLDDITTLSGWVVIKNYGYKK